MGKAGDMEKKDKRYLGAGAAFLGVAVLLKVGARSIPGFADGYVHSVYRGIVGTFGWIFDLFPFSVVEIGLYGLIFAALLYIGWNFRKPMAVACRGVFLAGVLLFLYVSNCGINYHGMAFSQYSGLKPEPGTLEELTELCRYLTKQVNDWAPDEENGKEYQYRKNRQTWRQAAVEAMAAAGEEFPALAGYYPKPKEVAVSWILSVQQLCGIYSPFTVEANYNGDMPDYNVPHTMCHELSHLKGFMREDEANFIGYLACISSKEPAFCYSGYLTGWVYAGNALAAADPEVYWELAGKLCDRARQDLAENNAFWGQYEGAVAEAASQWNDAYLKMNDQKEGVRSYGRMVDLMLAYELGK